MDATVTGSWPSGTILALADGVSLNEDPRAYGAFFGPRERQEFQASYRAGSNAILPIYGILSRHKSIWRTFFGSGPPTYTEIAEEVTKLAGDDSVSQIILQIDSPGGDVVGMAETAQAIRAAAQRKVVIAAVGGGAHSAAYCLASAASQVVAPASASVGSIGVFSVLHDTTKLQSEIGIQRVLVSSGGVKGLGADGAITDKLKAEVERQVLAHFDLFVQAVAAGRGVSASRVREAWGDGKTYLAGAAKQMGLIDQIGSINGILNPAGNGDTMSDKNTPTTAADNPTADLDALRATVAKQEATLSTLAEGINALVASQNAQTKERAEAAEKARAAGVKQVVQGLVHEGKLAPAARDAFEKTLLACQDAEAAATLVRAMRSQASAFDTSPMPLPSETLAGQDRPDVPKVGKLPQTFRHYKLPTKRDPQGAIAHAKLAAEADKSGHAQGSDEWLAAYVAASGAGNALPFT